MTFGDERFKEPVQNKSPAGGRAGPIADAGGCLGGIDGDRIRIML